MKWINQILTVAKVERDVFLRTSLQPYASSEKIEKAISSEVLSEHLTKEIIDQAGEACIKKRCFYAGGLSFGASMSGAIGTMVLLPLDFAQFAYHAAKLSQELYYLYGTNHMFTYQKQEDLEVLIYMLAGAGGAITLSTSSMSALGLWLYQKGCQKISMRAVSAIPFVGGVMHGSMSAYALSSLAEEYRDKLKEMADHEIATTPKQVAKQIGTFIDVEYHTVVAQGKEAEEKFQRFCNLEKLRELYMFLEQGYINEQEFEQLKLDL